MRVIFCAKLPKITGLPQHIQINAPLLLLQLNDLSQVLVLRGGLSSPPIYFDTSATNMHPDIQCLQKSLQMELQENEKESNLIRRAENAVSLTNNVLQELRKIISTYTSSNQSDIIEIHKYGIPPVYAEYVYYATLHNMETNKPLGVRVRDYYLKELERVDRYVKEHEEFLRYYRSGKNYLDEIYFVPGSTKLGMYIDLYSPMMEDTFCTQYSFKAGVGIAYLRLQKDIFKLIQQVKREIDPVKMVYWTHSKTNLIEMIYACYAAGIFNNGKATIKEITQFFENAFNLKLGNTSLTFQEILRRKSSTAFIDDLKEKLVLYIDSIDNKKFK